MSSTTERRGAAGQVLVIFALSLFGILVIAALAFDAGMMLLERRDQQNAADAAALAGARFLVNDPARADPAARDMATENGFTDGASSAVVQVNIPPTRGQFTGFPGFIEVVISAERASILGSIIGVAGWDISARAVAANQQGLDLPFSMLALHGSKCGAIGVTGSGIVNSAGTVQVNSSCMPNALDVGGLGALTVSADGAVCNTTGESRQHGANAQLNCTEVEHSYAIRDPLEKLDPPPVPAYPLAIQQISGPTKSRPVGCPGSSKPATATAPADCNFGGSYDGTVWRIHPGYYPGGLDFGKGSYYLEPGVYYLGGGGFRAANGNLRSVDAGGSAFGGGVLIYNTEAYEFTDECAAGTAPKPALQCLGQVELNGGSTGVSLMPLDDGSRWDGLVVYQDRHLDYSRANPDDTDVKINGGGSLMEVAGTIYVPTGDVHVNGSGGTLIMDQVIANTFTINGNGGTIDVLYRSGVTARVSGVGLVE